MRLMITALMACLCASPGSAGDHISQAIGDHRSQGTGSGVTNPGPSETGPSASELVSFRCPRITIDDETVGGIEPLNVTGKLESGDQVDVSYEPIPLKGGGKLIVTTSLQWYPNESVCRKWASIRLAETDRDVVIKEVVLDEIDAKGRDVSVAGAPPGSYPAFGKSFFAGIEFPIAATRVESDRLLLAHRPGKRLTANVTYETRRAVIGLAQPGGEKSGFIRYIESRRPGPRDMHINYNSWWTSPMPYSEADILSIMGAFEQSLYKPHGVALDTFSIDLGWSDPKSMWQIDGKRFPEGFTRIGEAAKKMGANLGLWISPSNCYSPHSFDNEWAKSSGYETFERPGGNGQPMRYLCLAGKRYQEAFASCLVEMVTRWGVRHVKLDGYVPTCPDAAHGHEPDELSSEAVADGAIGAFAAARKAAPEVWLEATCFGWNASPWWLFHVNSVIGSYGDDYPAGRVPCPVDRESGTTSRDYYNLQGAARLPMPASAQEVLGVIHQTSEPLQNDAVTVLMRGNMFMPLYINPAYMNQRRWQSLAGVLKWARANAGSLQDTRVILPKAWRDGKTPAFTDTDTMPREPYGYAHSDGKRALVFLRNPWIEPAKVDLKLDDSLGVPAAKKALSAVSLYPEARVYGSALHDGDTLPVPLAPYETIVLEISPKAAPRGAPKVDGAIGKALAARVTRKEIACAEFPSPREPFGPDWTDLSGGAASVLRVDLEATVHVSSPEAELLVLIEGDKTVADPNCEITINGKERKWTTSGSATAWSATVMPKREHWLFVRAPLDPEKNQVRLELEADVSQRVSVWVWATKPGKAGRSDISALPSPELISLDAVPLLKPVSIDQIPKTTEDAPIERIEGVFLDSLEPTSATQGYGTLQKNKSVQEQTIAIAGRRFLRGLGTHAPAKITYNLNGGYKRFQAWVGADAETTPSVTFEVWLDGAKKWSSGLMQRETPAKRVDIDISGAKTLELVVGDGGNGLVSDHADWADARLLR